MKFLRITNTSYNLQRIFRGDKNGKTKICLTKMGFLFGTLIFMNETRRVITNGFHLFWIFLYFIYRFDFIILPQ